MKTVDTFTFPLTWDLKFSTAGTALIDICDISLAIRAIIFFRSVLACIRQIIGPFWPGPIFLKNILVWPGPARARKISARHKPILSYKNMITTDNKISYFGFNFNLKSTKELAHLIYICKCKQLK